MWDDITIDGIIRRLIYKEMPIDILFARAAKIVGMIPGIIDVAVIFGIFFTSLLQFFH